MINLEGKNNYVTENALDNLLGFCTT